MIHLSNFLNEEKNEGIDYRFEHIDSYGGQSNYELGMYLNGNILGMVEYTLFNKQLTVSNIIVVPKYRRKGVASRMMQMVKDKHPDFKYIPSMKTDDGSKFKHKKIKDLYSLD